MKRFVPLSLLFLVALSIAPAAFADHCWRCLTPTWCAGGQTDGGTGCIYFQDPAWCEEEGWCIDGFVRASVASEWKVASVTVLKSDTSKKGGTDETVDSAVVGRSAVVRSARIR